MVANSRQVGGRHYKDTGYEHWDLVIRTGMGYLDGVATKYVARYQKSGRPVQDLEKALHYVEKLSENANICALRPSMPYALRAEELEAFLAHNGHLVESAIKALRRLVLWESRADLTEAAGNIHKLLTHERAKIVANHVPLEDSNKHAPRAGDDE